MVEPMRRTMIGRSVARLFECAEKTAANTSIGKELAITSTSRFIRGGEPNSIIPMRWAAIDVPSIMVEVDFVLLRESYNVPSDIELILRSLTNGPTSLGGDASPHLSDRILAQEMLKKKGKEKEPGWYYFSPWEVHKSLVTDCPSSIKQWKELWLWVAEKSRGWMMILN
ncbi:hypothetical protein Adt_02739 [Abeliophyllum distichum]|uniref:Uncharacterized protein n=1 Tax=Abeliophyllum distichum TaxID=126358 RepID=A0ABD1VWY5_9LAMI